jgi:hypothetical protein
MVSFAQMESTNLSEGGVVASDKEGLGRLDQIGS